MDSQHPGCWTGSVLACNRAVQHRRLSHFHTLSESARNNCCPLYVHFLNVVFQNKNKMLQSQEIQDQNYLLPIVFFRHRNLDKTYFTSLLFHYFEYFDICQNVRSIKSKWYSRLKSSETNSAEPNSVSIFVFLTTKQMKISKQLCFLEVPGRWRLHAPRNVVRHLPIQILSYARNRTVLGRNTLAHGPGRPVRLAAHRQPLCWNSCTIHELFCLQVVLCGT